MKRALYQSPLGELTLLADDTGLYGVWFTGQKYFGASFDLDSVPLGDNAALQAGKAWLAAYFNGEQAPRPAVHFSGTAFRQAVQQALCQIPYGQTVTYSQLATKVSALRGHKTSARAIGGAVGHNPLSLVVPCHRVVGANGSLTGYAGGLDRKVALLKLEGSLAQ